MHLYLALFPIFWLAALSRWIIRLDAQGGLETWTLNTMPANDRLRHWLARALAWPNEDFSAELSALGGARFF